jgi:H+/Cl- antiporter ClcA
VLAVNRSIELSARFWLVLAATGVGAGLAGGLLMRLLHAAQHLAWSYDAGTFLEAVGRVPPIQRVGVVLAAGALVAVGAAVLRFRKGGHAGEISVAIWFHAGATPVWRTLGRAVLSILIVAMGAPVGREGALKQSGAVIGWKLADVLALTDPQKRLLTACGAGAGMAAAYNIPLGGALFALEVLLGSMSLPFVVPALACAMLATSVSWLLLPMKPTYVTPTFTLSLEQVGWALVAGPIIGALAIVYVRLIAWADHHKPKTRLATVAAPLLTFAGLGLAALVLPQLLGNGLDLVQQSFLGQGGALPLILSLAVLRPLATALCLHSGAPGGLFTPTLATGALLGSGLAKLWDRAAPAWAANPGSCAVIGGAAMLAAATEGPVSAVVSVVELGQHLDFLLVPLCAAVAGAMIVVRFAGGPSIYSARVRAGARAPERSDLPAFARAAGVSHDFLHVSAAAHPAIAVQKLLVGQERDPPCPVFVLDEQARPIGRLSDEKVRRHDQTRQPIDLLTAYDLAEAVRPVGLAELETRPTAGRAESPVVDGSTGAIVGVLEPKQREDR